MERIDNIDKYEFEVKCIPIIGLCDKFSALLQMIADGKIYLRHLPIFEDDERSVTPGRFLMALIGLENSLDSLDIHALHGEKHLAEIGRARKADIMELCPDLSTSSIEIALRALVEEGFIERRGGGRSTFYVRKD